MAKLTGYDLSRQWFEMIWETPKITANHTALYLWLCEIWNRLGQPKNFQITSTECMAGMCVKSYNTYKKTFDDLKEMGCINLIKQSTNQYQCNVIELLKFDKAPDKALNKAQVKARNKALETFIKPENPEPTTLNPEHISAPQKEDAVPEAISDEVKAEEEKKEKVPPKEKKERTDLHHRMLKIYSGFMIKLNNIKPQITGQDGEGVKRIIEYLKKIVKGEKTDDEICLAFEYILDKWDKLEPFIQKQIKPTQIHSNLNTIITQIKHPKLNFSQNGKQTQGHSREDIVAAVQGRISSGVQQDEPDGS